MRIVKCQCVFDEGRRFKQRFLLTRYSGELNANWQAVPIQTTGQGNDGLTGRVEWHGQPGPGDAYRFFDAGIINNQSLG